MKSEAGRLILGLVITIILIIFFKRRAVPVMLFLAAIGFGISYLIFWGIERAQQNKTSGKSRE